MEKCYFLKILQWPDFEILGGHSHHQDTPKNQKARHGTFFFIRITFSSHVKYLLSKLILQYFKGYQMYQKRSQMSVSFPILGLNQKFCKIWIFYILSNFSTMRSEFVWDVVMHMHLKYVLQVSISVLQHKIVFFHVSLSNTHSFK